MLSNTYVEPCWSRKNQETGHGLRCSDMPRWWWETELPLDANHLPSLQKESLLAYVWSICIRSLIQFWNKNPRQTMNNPIFFGWKQAKPFHSRIRPLSAVKLWATENAGPPVPHPARGRSTPVQGKPREESSRGTQCRTLYITEYHEQIYTEYHEQIYTEYHEQIYLCT